MALNNALYVFDQITQYIYFNKIALKYFKYVSQKSSTENLTYLVWKSRFKYFPLLRLLCLAFAAFIEVLAS